MPRREALSLLSHAEIEAIAAKMPNRETAARWVKAVSQGFAPAEIDAAMRRLAATLERMEPSLEKTAMVRARPGVADWYARMQAREAFQAAMNWRPGGTS